VTFKPNPLPMNQAALNLFRFQVGWLWHRAPSRRSHKGRVLRDRRRSHHL